MGHIVSKMHAGGLFTILQLLVEQCQLTIKIIELYVKFCQTDSERQFTKI